MPDEVLSDFPHRAGELAAFGQHVIERGDEQIDFAFADDERRQNLHHVHGVAGDLGQDAVLAQHLGHDHLGEENLVDFVQELPRHLELELDRLVELDRDNQPFCRALP
jgi:hypothetical protein